MSKFDEEVSLLINNLTTIIPAIADIQLVLLKDWCRRNNWSDFQIVQCQFYAIPPGGYIPVPLPKVAFALPDKYRQVFDKLWEIQFLESVSEVSKENALVLTGSCFFLLCLKELFKKSTNPTDVHQLINLAVALLMMFALPYIWAAISCYWKQCRCKSKLNRMPEFVDLLARLEISHARNIY